MKVKGQHPAPHAKYLVERDGILFTATPCYGMHEPWWVVRTMASHNMGEVEPVPMRPDDAWWSLDEARRKIVDPEPHPLARELATYERLKPALLAYAEGQHVVIKGDTCHAVERTYEDALRVAYAAIGPMPFLVKQVLAVEPVMVMRPG